MPEIREITTGRSAVCEAILRALPAWFGIERAIMAYVQDVTQMRMWVAEENDVSLGFLALHHHNASTAEIHVMGVLTHCHRRGVGRRLIQAAEAALRESGHEYLEVKTLSASHPDLNYARTRDFYLALGFRPVEEFKTLWGESNPCLLMIKKL